MLKKGKSGSMNGRTPLADVSNCRIAKEKIQADRDKDESLDRLLLARSELSALVNQIDRIFATVLDHNTKSRTNNMDIESFIKLLSSMNSSLKPWVSKLSEAQATTSTPAVQFSKSMERIQASSHGDKNSSPSTRDEPELGMIISPSPLVAWRAGGCGLVTERQLFLLTPLSKPNERSKVKGRNLNLKETNGSLQLCSLLTISKNHGNLPGIMEELDGPKPCIVEENSNVAKARDFKLRSEAYKKDMTPPKTCTSMKNSRIDADDKEALEWFLSPPKTCTLMDPDNGLKHPSVVEKKSLRTSNPFPLDDSNIPERFRESHEPRDGVYDDDDLEIHDLQLCNFANKRDFDEKLEWFLSPPKTCALMEPLEGKVPSTPSILVESVFKSCRRAGENTLKKELWTRFQAVSVGRLSFKDSVLQKVAKKGFMDMLEEASF